MSKSPLGLPEGSVRAILAILLVATVCIMAALGRSVPELLASMSGVAIAGYFSQRNNSGPSGGNGGEIPSGKETAAG